MRAIGRALLWFGAGLLATVVIVFLFPGLVLNTRTASFVLDKLGNAYGLRWDSLTVRARGLGLNKRVVVTAKELCVDEPHGAAKGCVTRFELDATVRLGFGPLLTLRRLDRLFLHTDPLFLAPDKLPKQEPPEKEEASGGSPLGIGRFALGELSVDVPAVTLVTATGTTKAALRAVYSPSSGPFTAAGFLVLPATKTTPSRRYELSASLDSDMFRKGRLSFLRGALSLKSGKDLAIEATGSIEPQKGDRVELKGRATARLGPRTIEGGLDGTGTGSRWEVLADLGFKASAGKISRARVSNCRLKAALDEDTGLPRQGEGACSITVEPAPFGLKSSAPRRLEGRLTFGGRQNENTFEAELESKLEPARDFYDFSSELSASVSGRKDDPLGTLRLRAFELAARIPEFARFVKALDGTEWAVPAPLNALKGKVALEAKGQSKGRAHAFEWSFKTGLEAGRQAVHTLSKGTIEVPRAPGTPVMVKADIALQRVALELPRLKIGPPPAVKVDPRIKTGASKSAEKAAAQRPQIEESTSTAVRFDIKVHTSSPIVLYSNLVKDPIPIAVDLRATQDGAGGKIDIRTFRMEVFRQVGTIEYVNFRPEIGSSAVPIDGKVVYRKQDYVITLRIAGSNLKPVVELHSVPPMTPNEIVGLLIYGKSPAELDNDQQASAGNAAAALTSGALGLASLYLFASTPIDSVGYDPATQSYEVRFKLPGGATLAVGSDLQESKTLTLRKRVAKDLELQTEASTGQQQERNALTTFLQWFNRY